MKLLEYEAKLLLDHCGITTPQSKTVRSDDSIADIDVPVVIKSQVPVGGRGKAGGVIIVKDKNLLDQTITRIRNLPISGFVPRTLLAEKMLEVKQEFYLSISIDKNNKTVVMLANSNGGVEVEGNETDSFLRIPLTEPESKQFTIIGEKLAEEFKLPEKTYALQELAEKMYQCFINNDAILLEINPLILTLGGDIVAGDCKMQLDDSASFRHSDWSFEYDRIDSNFVTLNEAGNVATIANGAGLAMATVDAVAAAGMTPANFLDIGGGASKESVLEAFRKIMLYPNVKAIVINIFAGITRCDEVAGAIISAQQEIFNLPPLYIRLAGTNATEASILLQDSKMTLYENLSQALEAAKVTA